MTTASDALARRIRHALARRSGVVEKKIVGGIGFMLNGNLAVGTNSKGEMLVRIDPARAKEALARPGAFQMMMGEREMTGYVGVDPATLEDPDEMKRWIAYAVGHVILMEPK